MNRRSEIYVITNTVIKLRWEPTSSLYNTNILTVSGSDAATRRTSTPFSVFSITELLYVGEDITGRLSSVSVTEIMTELKL